MTAGLSVFLIAVTWLVFGQTLGNEFINYDDGEYVYQNPQVRSGLSLRGVLWAFRHSHAYNWHPVTSITHMLDCQLYGLKAGGHHFTNVVLHTLAVVLLFLVLRKMTGAIWRSVFVAALFAIHPLRVESVAWIAERKDVLSGVFFMLTLGAYARYARKPSLNSYLTMSMLFACGLMSKPMLVTIPFVLLLLDYWPLNRFSATTARRMVFEKIPLFALSLASCLLTVAAQSESVGALEQLPLNWRIQNALVSYVTYISQMYWPTNLAVFYPHAKDKSSLWSLVFAVTLLLAVSATAIALRKRRPYLPVGWFWYLGMLVPVIGVFQVGLQGHADRYTYLPQIGLYIAMTWGIVDLCAGWRYRKPVLALASTILIAALAVCAWKQTTYWRDSESLWTHTLAVTSNNDVAHNMLGTVFEERGQIDRATAQYEAALTAQSSAKEARYNASNALTHVNLGNANLRAGQVDQAIAHYEKAVELAPDSAGGHYYLATALFQKGRIDEAIIHYSKTISIHPDDVEARISLGDALLQKGSSREAIAHYQTALDTAPLSVLALNNLAWVLSTSLDATVRDGDRAMDLAQKADRYSAGNNAIVVRTLAAAYAEDHRFNDAIETANRGFQIARMQGQTRLANEIGRDIELYRANMPIRDHPPANGRPAP